jgi:hypothetical protein
MSWRIAPNNVKGLAAFCDDHEWVLADFNRDKHKHGAARLPHGMIAQIDRSLHLRGALVSCAQRKEPTVERVADLNEPKLNALLEQRYPGEHWYIWRAEAPYGTLYVIVVGIRQFAVPA